MSTSLKLYATSNGKSVNSTFSSLNTNATPAQMKSAAQALNSLTDNTYSKSEKIETTELDSFAPKLTPNIALSSTVDTSTLTRSFCLGGQNLLLVVETDGEISIVNNDNTSWCSTIRLGADTNQYRFYIGIVNSQTATNATAGHIVVVESAETAQYEAGRFELFTILEG